MVIQLSVNPINGPMKFVEFCFFLQWKLLVHAVDCFAMYFFEVKSMMFNKIQAVSFYTAGSTIETKDYYF